jgi:hypothetical protein
MQDLKLPAAQIADTVRAVEKLDEDFRTQILERFTQSRPSQIAETPFGVAAEPDKEGAEEFKANGNLLDETGISDISRKSTLWLGSLLNDSIVSIQRAAERPPNSVRKLGDKVNQTLGQTLDKFASFLVAPKP